MRWINVALIGLTLLLSACSADAVGPEKPEAPVEPQPPSDPLTAIVDSVRLAWGLPAMGAAIVTLEEGVASVAVAGTRRASGGPVVTTQDLWHLGSNTKAMTALLAAVAVSRNRIEWTTTLAETFPELENIREEYRDVTLRDLLSHQSGFRRDAGGAGIGFSTSPQADRASVVAWAVEQPSVVSRGTFSYSNLGVTTAGAMLERVLGISYEAAMQEHVFGPLGAEDAGWGAPAAFGSATQPVAHRGQPDGSWLVLEGFDSAPLNNPAGRAHMSLGSWGLLIQEFLRVEAGTPTLAPPDISRETTSEAVMVNATTSYGLGWLIASREWAGGKVLVHDGTNGGNHSLAFVAPRRNVAYLVTTNSFDPGGRSGSALDVLVARLDAFHTTGK